MTDQNDTNVLGAPDVPPLRVATAGSVDDGKSTLLGRILFDSKALMADQLAHVEEASRRRGHARTDLALLTDGLRSEREQGITIDVAWRYFATPRRRFVLADAPGHVEYTRNMVTATSQADVALVLVDARAGVLEQTRRHLFIARLLAVPALAVVVNKMDLVGWDHAVFARLRDEVTTYLAKLPVPGPLPQVSFFPVSALHGDNVAAPSTSMPWYDGPTLVHHLETLRNESDDGDAPARFPVQWIVRPNDDARPDYRGLAGRISSGVLRRGDEVRILPGATRSVVRAIETMDGELEEARAGLSCVVHLADDVAASRGDVLVPSRSEAPTVVSELVADLAWVHAAPSRPGETYLVKHGTREVRARIEEVLAHLDVEGGAAVAGDAPIALNGLVRVKLRLFEPLPVDPYAALRATGSFLLVDPQTGATRAAGMARSS